jgi:hypothetical protein
VEYGEACGLFSGRSCASIYSRTLQRVLRGDWIDGSENKCKEGKAFIINKTAQNMYDQVRACNTYMIAYD